MRPVDPKIATWLDAALSRSPVQPLFMWRASRRLAVLAYHAVEDPERFAAQLEYVRSNCFPVTLDEAVHAIIGNRGLPHRAVLITFDDGDRSLVEMAMPMLRDRGLPGAAFIVAGVLGTNRPFWWNEVAMLVRSGGRTRVMQSHDEDLVVQALKEVADEDRLAAIGELRSTASASTPAIPQLKVDDVSRLESAGISVGNHTMSHPCLQRCSADRIRSEIADAHELLRRALGHDPIAFAYPDGGTDDRVVQAVGRAGYDAGFLFDHRLTEVPLADPLRVSRLRANAASSLDRFRCTLSGLHPTAHGLRTRFALLRARTRSGQQEGPPGFANIGAP
jgi:peptidoglycan/xylan/chitin deacetylase (PgdA/CDA1 family)